ncbi:MAG: MBL fold metallo-hydrolase [Desulfuromonadaceae bacterium]|nr:MBL fold metallo-hydrolase [Desulfuromonadaceae bacterium]MDD2848727.1 MBL fold metallo-hydrolase [Desulfuromonadaceae bacterium]MDD4130377.1 MBL fold metallo-hydrolase [Desulfuromonadaceae bacterium]
MKARITVLCENSVGPISGTLGEHGFSALIEPAVGDPLLFDTGQGLTLLHNARRMNKDLSKVKQVVISHGHYDHAGGLKPLLDECGPKVVYGHPGIFAPRYRVKDTSECYPIGIPVGRGELEAAGATFDLSQDFRELAPGLFLTGAVPRVTAFETGDQGLYCDCGGQDSDNTPDDQSLLLETGKGLVLILGCCHAGLINTLEHVANMTGRRDVYAVIGGTHLGFCGQEQLGATIAALRGMGIRKLAASHCTGFAASARLLREFPQEFQAAMVGYALEV